MLSQSGDQMNICTLLWTGLKWTVFCGRAETLDDRSNVYAVVATRLNGQLQQQPQMQLKAKWKSSAPRFRSFSTVNAHLLVGREQQHVDEARRRYGPMDDGQGRDIQVNEWPEAVSLTEGTQQKETVS